MISTGTTDLIPRGGGGAEAEAAKVENHRQRKLRKIARFRSSGDPAATAAVIAAGSEDSALTVIFASAHDLAALGRELAARGIMHVIGAATGRIIGADGFEATGVSGFHLPAGRFAAANVVLEEVAGMGLPEVRAHVRELRLELARSAGPALT